MPPRACCARPEIDARRLLDATHNALLCDGAALLQPREQFVILCALQAVADLLEACAEIAGGTPAAGQDLCNALRDATEALNRANTDFAARRMDSRVRQALAGQRIEHLAA